MTIDNIITVGVAAIGFASAIVTAIINRKIKKASQAISDGEYATANELASKIENLQKANNFLQLLVEVPEVVTTCEQILTQPGSGKGKKLLATTQIKEKAIAYGLQLSQEQKEEIDSQIEKVLESPTKKEEV